MVIAERGPGFVIETDDEPTINELIREYTLAVLKRHQGRALDTAAILGIGYTTFYQRLKKYRAQKRSEAKGDE